VEQRNPDVIFSRGFYLYEQTKKLEPYDTLTGEFPGSALYKILFQHNQIAVLSVLVKKSVIELVGLQDESLRAYGCEDWDYWLRICRKNFVFFGMEERLFCYRVHGAGTSSNKLSMHMAGCFIKVKNYDKSLLNKKEQSLIRKALIEEVCFIVNTLYKQNELVRIPYQLNLLRGITQFGYKFSVAQYLVKLFGSHSKRMVNFLIYH
jgi:hypothetical protein